MDFANTRKWGSGKVKPKQGLSAVSTHRDDLKID